MADTYQKFEKERDSLLARCADLRAEVERLRCEMEHPFDAAEIAALRMERDDYMCQRDAENARADAAEAVIEAVREIVEMFCGGVDGYGCGTQDPAGQSDECGECPLRPIHTILSRAPAPQPCEWTGSRDYQHDEYETKCGRVWDRGSIENCALEFCPFCGKAITLGGE